MKAKSAKPGPPPAFSLLVLPPTPWDTGISPPELLEFIEDHTPGHAIDMGCGTGTNVITLARAEWHVTGMDFAPRAIHRAEKKLIQAGLQAEVSVNDATRMRGINGPYDLALDIGFFLLTSSILI